VAEHVSAASQRPPGSSPPDRDHQVASEYQQVSESSTSSATDPGTHEPSTAAAAQQAGAGRAERGASGVDTDATTCDTVSATMWFDRPEVATSFVTCEASDDDDDADTINSNNYNDEDGKTKTKFVFIEARR